MPACRMNCSIDYVPSLLCLCNRKQTPFLAMGKCTVHDLSVNGRYCSCHQCDSGRLLHGNIQNNRALCSLLTLIPQVMALLTTLFPRATQCTGLESQGVWRPIFRVDLEHMEKKKLLCFSVLPRIPLKGMLWGLYALHSDPYKESQAPSCPSLQDRRQERILTHLHSPLKSHGGQDVVTL